jgi:hypothetical protein
LRSIGRLFMWSIQMGNRNGSMLLRIERREM